MAYVSNFTVTNCSRIRIKTSVYEESTWYEMFVDNHKLCTIHSPTGTSLPLVVTDRPSRLLISGKENNDA